MKISDIIQILDAQLLTPQADLDGRSIPPVEVI